MVQSSIETDGDFWPKTEGKIRRYVSRRLTSRSAVDDTVQEALLRVHQYLPNINNPLALDGWIYRVARSALFKRSRSESHFSYQIDIEAKTSLTSADPSAISNLDNEDNAERALLKCLPAMVENLPAAYKDAVVLTELLGLTHSEASEVLSLSVAGTKSRVQRGRALLRKSLEDCCEIEVDTRGRVMSSERKSDSARGCGCK